jgi:hypothetical protein
MSKDGKRPDPEGSKKPANQTGEKYGSVKNQPRGEDNFQGHSDTPRGSESETRGSSGPRH